MTKINVLDLFSGAGGLTLGFYQNKKFDIKLSVDYDKNTSITYSANFPKIKHIVKDILTFKDEEIIKIKEEFKIDLIIGGPPCQGFSIAGNIGRLELDDERNLLFLSYLKFVKIVNPRMFVMENVAKLLTHNKGKTIKIIKEEFNKLGYKTHIKVINSVDYDVPQKRRRIFIIGSKLTNEYIFPTPENNIKTLESAISDLPALKSGEKSTIPNHNAMNHSKQMLIKMSYVKEGMGRECIPHNLRPKSGDSRKYIRLNRYEPSFCVTGDMRKIFHYSQNRALTCRELARIQTFPDSFIFHGNSISIQQQIGNAVPPRLAYIISKSIEEVFENEISNN